MRDFGLRDKVVVITGGGGALGSAFARGFADSGASLALLDFNLDKAKATVTSFPVEKVKAIAVAADVSKDEQYDAAFLKSIVPASLKITLAPGQKTTQDVRVQ